MSNHTAPYKALALGKLNTNAGLHQPHTFSPQLVRADSPAIDVMTDLKLVAAATIDSETLVDVANQAMIARGVRSLLVLDATTTLVGLLTARDILGERPMQVVRDRGLRHDEIRVKDIMTPGAAIEVLQMTDVLRAKVGQILETLKQSGRQHALVVDQDTVSGRQMVRGVFSASQIARQLGIPMQTAEVARTFAEIEAVIAGENN